MRTFPFPNAYFSAEVHSDNEDDAIPTTYIQAGYEREADAHLVAIAFGCQPYQLDPHEALKIAAALTLAAEAAITKDNS